MLSENNEEKIGIIGLGLIGGSLALRLSKGFPVVALSKNQELLNSRVFDFKVIDNLSILLKKSSMIFICSPLHQIQTVLLEIKEELQRTKIYKKKIILTDVGSTKTEICKFAKELFKEKKENLIFIGGHPMSGTEKSGFQNAFETIFEDNPWALTPEEELLGSIEIKRLKKIITYTGSNLIELSSEDHDQAVAWVSHLPLLLSLGLNKTIEKIKDPKLKETSLKLASSGFESMIRLAKGNQVLNRDLIELNKKNLRKSFKAFLESVKEFL